MGESGGRGVQDGEHTYTHGWFMWMYGKNRHNIVISLHLNLKKKKKQRQIEKTVIYKPRREMSEWT